jgi:hypothetical protein
MPVCNRPDYTKKSLEAIHRLWGFDKHPIYVSIDLQKDGTFNKGVRDIVSDFNVNYEISEQKSGCNGNVRSALRMAWADPEVDVVICVEDDVICSPIALKYVEWAANEFKDNKAVRTIALWSHRTNPWKAGDSFTEKTPFHIQFENHFNAWGWACNRKNWEEIDSLWTTGGDHESTSWDVITTKGLKGRVECSPSVSYAYNIGEENGTHRGAAWPGFLVDGFISELTPVSFWYDGMPSRVPERRKVFVMLGASGDLYMICKEVPKDSIIATSPEYSAIVYELFPELEVYEIEGIDRNKLKDAVAICAYKYPTCDIILAQQDGQGQDVVKPYRNFEQFQIARAKI